MILYFSGTGNSKYASKLIAEYTKDNIISLNERIKNNDLSDLYSEKPLVFAVPTYAWRIPRIVETHIEKTLFTGCSAAYFVLTCGSDTGRADIYAKKLCSEKGWTFMGLETIVMPENYTAMFKVPDKAEAERIISNAKPNIISAALKIKNGDILETQSSTGRLKSGIVNSAFYNFCVKAYAFYSTEDCISCSFCAEICPLNNITLINGRPKWGNNCTHCMGCINRCPKTAIEYGRASLNKNRYFI